MRAQLAAIGGIGLAFVAGFLWHRDQIAPEARRGAPVVVGVVDDETHLVSPEMQSASDAMAGQVAPDFFAPDGDGRSRALEEAIDGRPAVLVFIKDGCPCSASAEPFFRSLHEAYGDRASFLGVIDGAPAVAARWADRHGTPYPVVADPDLEIIRAFDAWNSAYVALVGTDGRIEAMWPGYSAGMLGELSGRLASAAGVPEASLDVSEAPELPYSGCPFDLDDREAAEPPATPLAGAGP